ncbi:MAG: DUF354 domain-containing protein [Thermoanaerobaculia bacterium]|nr:DUF354 domain-containing protein [Thermoanaerobaculia bacterium]
MRILIDITHPAHAHFFRHALDTWRQRGHDVVVTGRRKDITYELLDRLGIEYHDLGAARSGLLGLAVELPARTARLARQVHKFKPDVMAAIGGTFIAQAGWICRVPTVVFYDTENATVSNLLTYPVCTVVSTPRCYEGWVPRRKHDTYAGYHELAYTHPSRFTPDPEVLGTFDLEPGEPFVFMRLVSWGASHDVTDHGLTRLEEAVRQLEPFGRVLISSERELPSALEGNRLVAAPHQVHHLLYYARLFIGESATMASESATLGTPAVFVSTSVRGYTNEQESRYGLTFTFSDPETGQRDGLAKAVEILNDGASKSIWEEKRNRMLADTVDVTDHIVDLVESFGSN